MDIVWNTIDQSGWENATRSVAVPMQQHWLYGAVLSALGGEVARAEVYLGGRRIGLAQTVARRIGPLCLTVLNRGPIWLEPVAPAIVPRAQRALAHGSGLMIATPESGQGGWGLLRLLAPRHRAMIDLRPDLATIRARLSGKWRNRLVHAERAALTLRRCVPTKAELERLLARDAAQQRRCGYRALPPAFTLGWQQLDPEGVVLYEALYCGRTVAAMLILLHRPTASYHIGWSDATGRMLDAHRFLLWQVICELRTRGLIALDLGDVDTRHAPGLARFKIGSGAYVAPLGATLLVLPRLIPQRS